MAKDIEARHISRMTTLNVMSTANMELMDQIKFDPNFTNPRILKITLTASSFCTITLNGHSELQLVAGFGISLDYNDMIIESMVVSEDGVGIYAVIGY